MIKSYFYINTEHIRSGKNMVAYTNVKLIQRNNTQMVL